VEFLDPIFDVAARAVDALVDKAGHLPAIGNHEARIVAGVAPGEPHHFGLAVDYVVHVLRQSREENAVWNDTIQKMKSFLN